MGCKNKVCLKSLKLRLFFQDLLKNNCFYVVFGA